MMQSFILTAKRVINQEIAGLSALERSIDQTFDQIIKLILSSKGKIVLSGMGKSGYIARKIAATLSSTGTPAIFLHPAEASHGDLGVISRDDIVMLLSNSGETQELNSIVLYCTRFDIPIIGVTRNGNSSLSNVSHIKIVLPNISEAANVNAPTTSTTMMMALGDAIAVALLEHRQFSDEDFKIFHPGGSIGVKLLSVNELMHSGDSLPIVTMQDSAAHMLLEMSKKRMGCTGVVNDQGDLIGIVTDGDLRRHIHLNIQSSTVKDFMTKSPITIEATLLGSQAIAIMQHHEITALFVVHSKIPIGVIHLHDLLKAGLS